MSKSQRTKGAGGERELCAILSEAMGRVVQRKLGQARDSGNDIDLAPFRIECKRRKRLGYLYAWIEQADDDSGAMPTLALRQDGSRWLMVMYLDDWIKLAREEIAK